MNLFGNVKQPGPNGQINRHANFATFGIGMLTLFRQVVAVAVVVVVIAAVVVVIAVVVVAVVVVVVVVAVVVVAVAVWW